MIYLYSVLVYFGHLHNYVLCIHPILPGVHTMIVPGAVASTHPCQVVSYNMAMTRLVRVSHWRQALGMLQNMAEESMRPDGTSYNVAISILLAKFSKRMGVARGILRQDSVTREKGFGKSL